VVFLTLFAKWALQTNKKNMFEEPAMDAYSLLQLVSMGVPSLEERQKEGVAGIFNLKKKSKN
jgi:hypothetical protein